MVSEEHQYRTKPDRRRVLGTIGAGLATVLAGRADGVTSDDEPIVTHPETVPVDEPFTLEIAGLPEGTTVEVTATADDARDVTWSATATYDASDGTVDLDEDAPTEGPYETAETMRLIQHMHPEDGGGLPYVPPPEERLSIDVTADGDAVGSTAITRPFGDPAVTATDLEPPNLVGEVFEPPGSVPAPGVVVLHGSEGEPRTGMARLLASHGFIAVALQYFGAAGLPSELVEVPVELVDEAATWLLQRDRVDGSRIGLIGASKGGELALLAGSRFESIGAVVGISASGVAWAGVSMTEPSADSSWTVDGEPVPYVPYTDDPTVWDREPPLEFEPAYAASLEAASADRIEEATIPVEEIDGPVLLVSGGADRLWNAVELSSIAIDRLEAHDHPHEHLVFDEAGHAIQYPYLPTANRAEVPPFVLGGTPAGYAEADAAYWPRALETLRRA
ncbi:acyl-CoA thioesterase/bile acid-CoA:amino acid N-acyltransferase family protein [Halopiger djelfimassiliensis]|uniref:acyl-CoA thioesterase/bile acid-CoA:amino acid N-acyltransferase family protein n=1 Tax=Halopiger djelfimassiliensis TaxID=1293047 RepID=UPI0006778380|nr:acyl-CoA thioesterase/bile acid-CoA:amino acid N-acyltransferase family protein [Halopiger djelfimassiliensis]